MKSPKFKIKFNPSAAKDLRKLTKKQLKIVSSLIESIDCLSGNPYYGKPLKGNKKGCYSLRVGNYRIIYEVYLSKKIVYIIRIGHRKDIYR